MVVTAPLLERRWGGGNAPFPFSSLDGCSHAPLSHFEKQGRTMPVPSSLLPRDMGERGHGHTHTTSDSMVERGP